MTERPKFKMREIELIDCIPGNADHDEGEPISIATVSAKKDGAVENLMVSLADSRRLVTMLLVSLATYDDEFAKHLLNEHFPADGDGRFYWPDDGRQA